MQRICVCNNVASVGAVTEGGTREKWVLLPGYIRKNSLKMGSMVMAMKMMMMMDSSNMMMMIKIVAHHWHYQHGPLSWELFEADDGEYDYVL